MKKPKAFLLVTTLFLFVAGLVSINQVTQASGNSPSVELQTEADKLDVVLSGMTDVIAVEFDIAFDPSVISVDALTAGECPEPDFVLGDSFDNTAGQITFGSTSISGSCDTGGVAMSFDYSCVGAGSTTLNFVTHNVVNSNGEAIDHMMSECALACGGGTSSLACTALAIDLSQVETESNSDGFPIAIVLLSFVLVLAVFSGIKLKVK